MAASIKEQITAAVATALEGISVANGYNVDVTEIVRPRRTGERFTPVNYGIAVIQGDCQRAEDYDLASNPPIIAWRLAIACDCVLRLSEASTTAMDTAVNELEADVQKCLMADQTFGGLALLTELGAVEYPAGGNGAEGVTVWIYVTYRVSDDDPYEQR
jgi:hypothetical protein